MSPGTSPEVKFEIGHVLFIDIVGYSQLLITQQSEQLETLRRIVRATAQFRAAEAEGKLLRLPTGDGGALVFRTTPEAPVLCALEIARELKKHPELRVRMGIHSGPVNAITGLNEQANIAGAGINIAQRVMDCGDAGHILLSKHVAEDLEHYPRWQPYLHDLGECEVKHGERVSVVNLYTDDAGNAALPTRLAPQKRSPAKGTQSTGFRTLLVAAMILIGLGVPALIFAPAILKSLRSPISREKAASSSIPDKSIAVLPFENLSDDKNAAYFADGIQDEILTKLASIADLKVISRTSTARYKSKPEDLKTVSQQLGVANLLEGSVQKAADKVRVNVQLIDARADSHLWAKTYDRDMKDVFAIQSEVAQEIADSLQAKLSPTEASTLATAPTKDTVAYDLFLKGEYEERLADSSLKAESFDQAAAWYRQAIARDPNFALAMARLVQNRIQRHWFIERMSEAQLGEVRSLAEQAVALAPNLAQAHVALGHFYYHGYRKYEEALAEFGRALQLQPNATTALEYAGYVHRRQGKWERCLDELKKALEQNPRDASLAANLAATYTPLRMWKEAERTARHALEIDPHAADAMRTLLESIFSGSGDLNEAQRALATFPVENKISVSSNIGDVRDILGDRAYVLLLARNFEGALKVWEPAASNPTDERRRLSARVAISVLAGDFIGAQAEAEKARQSLEERLRERPDDILSMPQLTWVYLALKRNDDAIKIARQAAQLLPPEKDVIVGNLLLNGLAEIEARTGGSAEAIAILRRLLTFPAGQAVSIARLKIDPVWDPIRNDPGFQQLLTGTEHIGP
jgi:TolB-like protein/Tfp pilus assembly protein PilF/class 3 adenylate cyclase